jgi:hypothetical protein
VFLSDELRTNLVAEAAFSLDIPALCKAYGISTKTLERAKLLCSSNAALTAEVEKKKLGLQAEWSARGVLTLNELLTTMRHQALQQRARPFEQGDMRETAGAIKLLGEVLLTEKVLPNGPRRALQDSKPAEAAGVGARAGRGREPAGRAPGAGAGTGPAPTGGPAKH